jgi:hypothetical protein
LDWGNFLPSKKTWVGSARRRALECLPADVDNETFLNQPGLGRAAMPSRVASQPRANVWHDHETFLNQPGVYRKSGMCSVEFPPNSGDLSPIETVWARLRRDLSVREMADLQAGR